MGRYITMCQHCNKVFRGTWTQKFCSLEHREAYNSSPEIRFEGWKASRKERGEFTLTFEDWIAKTKEKCFLCGYDNEIAYLTRYEASDGFTVENTVPVCKTCSQHMPFGRSLTYIVEYISQFLDPKAPDGWLKSALKRKADQYYVSKEE